MTTTPLPVDPVAHSIEQMLEAVRSTLDVDVAFVSRFNRGERVLRHVAGAVAGVEPGTSDPLDATYCTRIVDGSLPTLTDDAKQVPALAELEVTDRLGIRSYAGVPLVLRDGEVYGTLCAFGVTPRDFRAIHARTLEVVASLIAHHLSEQRQSEQRLQARRAEVEDLLVTDALVAHVQPVVDLPTGLPVGWEALMRFPDGSGHSTEEWFDLARETGLATELERRALGAALSLLDDLPAGQFLACNLSAGALLDHRTEQLLTEHPLDRVVLELTEQQLAEDRTGLHAVLRRLRSAGMRLAMDDVGSGYAGLERVLRLRPDLIKLDRQIIDGVARDDGRLAMVRAFETFATSQGAEVIAEGIETPAEADAVGTVGVRLVQGYLFGRPAPPDWTATRQPDRSDPGRRPD